MDIDFRDPTNELEKQRSDPRVKSKFDKLVRCLFSRPAFISVIAVFLENWRFNNSASDILLRLLRKDAVWKSDMLSGELAETLCYFGEIKMSVHQRETVLASFLEYMVYKKLTENYNEDVFHRIYAYDLLVYVQNQQVDSKRVDVGLIISCKNKKAVQVFECKSFPQEIDDIREKVKFLDRLGSRIGDISAEDEIHEIYLMTLHNEDTMRRFNITRSFYPNIIFLDRKGIQTELLERPPLCPCKSP